MSITLPNLLTLRHRFSLTIAASFILLCTLGAIIADDRRDDWLNLTDPEVLREHAVRCLDRGEVGFALELLQAANQEYPGDAAILHLLGEVLIESDELDTGMDCFTRALEIDPGMYASRLSRARLLVRRFRNAPKCLAEIDRLPASVRADPIAGIYKAEAEQLLGHERRPGELIHPRLYNELLTDVIKYRRQSRFRRELNALLSTETIKPSLREVSLRIAVLLEKLDGSPGKPETYHRAFELVEPAFWMPPRPIADSHDYEKNQHLLKEKMARARPTVLDALRIYLLAGKFEHISEIEHDFKKDHSLSAADQAIAKAIVAGLREGPRRASDLLESASSPEALVWKAYFLSRTNVNTGRVKTLLEQATSLFDKEYVYLLRPIHGRWKYTDLSFDSYSLTPEGVGQLWAVLTSIRDLQDAQITDAKSWGRHVRTTSHQELSLANRIMERFASNTDLYLSALWRRYNVNRTLGEYAASARDYEQYQRVQQQHGLAHSQEWIGSGISAYAQSGQFEKAVKLANKSVTLPDCPSAPYLFLYLLSGDHFHPKYLDQLVAYFKTRIKDVEAQKDHGALVQSYWALSSLCARQGELRAAREYFTNAKQLLDTLSADAELSNIRRFVKRTELRLEAGIPPRPEELIPGERIPNAISMFASVGTKESAVDYPALSRFVATDEDLHFSTGDYFLMRSELPAAAASYRRAYYLTTLDAKAKRSFPNFSIWEASRASQSRRDQYLNDLDSRLSLIPFDGRTLRNRADLHALMGNTDLAFDDLNALVRLEPTNHRHWLRRAELSFDAGNTETSLEDCQVAIDFQPESSDGFVLRGDIRADQGNLLAAIADWRMAAVRSSGFRTDEAFMRLVWIYAAAKDHQFRDPASALSLVKTSFGSLMESWPEVIAAAYAANSDFDYAIEWQNRALASDLLSSNRETAEARLCRYEAKQSLHLPANELLEFFNPDEQRDAQFEIEDNVATVDALQELGAELLVDAESGLVTGVDFRGLQTSNEVLASLGDLPTLTSVSLREASFSKAGVARIASINRLQHLDLRDTSVGNDGLAVLTGLKNLRTLRLSGKNGSDTSDDVGMKHIARLTNLRVLALDHLWVTGEGLSLLTPLKNLEDLSLEGTLIDDSTLTTVASAFPELRKLHISRTQISSDGLKHVGKINSLTELNLSEISGIGDDGLTHVAGLWELTALNLWRTKITDKGIKHLQEMTGLLSLNLAQTRVTNEGLPLLKRMKRLQYLNLDGTNISDEGLAELAALSSLRVLKLSRTAVTRRGAARLQAMLPGTQIQQ